MTKIDITNPIRCGCCCRGFFTQLVCPFAMLNTSNIYCHTIQQAQAKVSEAITNALDFGKKNGTKVS